MSLRLLIVAVLVSLPLLASTASSAEACSIATDFTNAPDNEQEYDPALAPEAPTMVDAYISHNYADDPPMGCGGVSSCGDIHGLNIVFKGVREDHLLRITHEDGSVVYATRGWADAEGNQQIFLPGYADIDQDMPFRIATIDEAGYPSADVEWVAENPQDNDPGCTAAGGQAAGWTTSLLLLLAIAGRRRRPNAHR